MKITMTGKYAFRHSPTVPVTVLSVWRPGNIQRQVITMDLVGTIRTHLSDGSVSNLSGNKPLANDLVPLRRKPQEIWVNLIGSDISIDQFFDSEWEAKLYCKDDCKTVHFREVLDDEESTG